MRLPPSRSYLDAETVPDWYYNRNTERLHKAANKLSQSWQASRVLRRMPSVPRLLPSPPSHKPNKRNGPTDALINLARAEALSMMLSRLGLRSLRTYTNQMMSLPNTPQTVPGGQTRPTRSSNSRPTRSLNATKRTSLSGSRSGSRIRSRIRSPTRDSNKRIPKLNAWQELPNVPNKWLHKLPNVPLEPRVKALVKNQLYKDVVSKRNKLHEQVFGADLCGWSKKYRFEDLRRRLGVMMPKAAFHEIKISDDGTSKATFLNYNRVAEMHKNYKKRYMITFVLDYCSYHASVVFHAFSPDRLFYFNSGFQPELRDFLEYATGRELVFLDFEPFQEKLKKIEIKDEFCIMHSAAFSYKLYKHFEESRPLGSPINNELNQSNIPFNVNSSNEPAGKKLAYEANVLPIYRAYVNTIYKNQTPLPSLAEFLLKLRKVTKKEISEYVDKTNDPGRNTLQFVFYTTNQFAAQNQPPSFSFYIQLQSLFNTTNLKKINENKVHWSKQPSPVFLLDGTVRNTNAIRKEIIFRRIKNIHMLGGIEPAVASVRVFQTCKKNNEGGGRGLVSVKKPSLTTRGNRDVNTEINKNQVTNKATNKATNKLTNNRVFYPKAPRTLPIATTPVTVTSVQTLSQLPRVKRATKGRHKDWDSWQLKA